MGCVCRPGRLAAHCLARALPGARWRRRRRQSRRRPTRRRAEVFSPWPRPGVRPDARPMPVPLPAPSARPLRPRCVPGSLPGARPCPPIRRRVDGAGAHRRGRAPTKPLRPTASPVHEGRPRPPGPFPIFHPPKGDAATAPPPPRRTAPSWRLRGRVTPPLPHGPSRGRPHGPGRGRPHGPAVDPPWPGRGPPWPADGPPWPQRGAGLVTLNGAAERSGRTVGARWAQEGRESP